MPWEAPHANRKRAEVERTTILALESGFRCGVASYRGRRVSGSDEPGGENDGYRARRGTGFLGLGTNWPGILLMAIGAILLVSGASF